MTQLATAGIYFLELFILDYFLLLSNKMEAIKKHIGILNLAIVNKINEAPVTGHLKYDSKY